MKKILAILAVASISSMYAGPYEETYPSTPRKARNYQADDYKPATSTQQIRNQPAPQTPVQQAPSQISVSDQNLTKSIDAALNSGKYGGGFKDVKVKVNNGNVRLSGTVDLLEYKSKAESIIKRLDGVKEVDNQITINH